MTYANFYREPLLLDADRHRHLKIAVLTDYSVASKLHAVYVSSSEFAQAALDFPIVFIKSGAPDQNGRHPVSPVVLLGLSDGENLCVDGSRWDARYIPATVRRYPFLMTRLDGSDTPALLIDSAWSGLSETEGEPLFEADGRAAFALTSALQFLETFDAEARQTQAFCASLVQLDILQEMSAGATLPGGETLSVDGFFTVNEEKLRALPDESVLGLHRSGMLTLLNVHLLSLNNMRHLVDRKLRRLAAPA